MSDLITSASQYLPDLFGPDDHIAVTLIHKHFDLASREHPDLARFALRLQRTARAHDFATPGYLRFFACLNTLGYEVYATANTVHPHSHGREITDISSVRHLYLDFDEQGERALTRLLTRPELPRPNYVVHISPGKFQILWNVTGFGIPDAELLLRALARDTGGDIAATDVAHVLRLPGFFNNKCVPQRHFVTAHRYHTITFTPGDFPTYESVPPATHVQLNAEWHPKQPTAPRSRSEHDLRQTLKRLRRHEGPPGVIPDHCIQDAIAWLTSERPDKPNPTYYATLTIGKAQAIIASTPCTAHSGER
jgi:hypothetical protein